MRGRRLDANVACKDHGGAVANQYPKVPSAVSFLKVAKQVCVSVELAACLQQIGLHGLTSDAYPVHIDCLAIISP